MSIWGAGPFEDDSSLDHLDHFGDTLEAMLKSLLRPTEIDLNCLYEVHSLISLFLLIQQRFGLSAIRKKEILEWTNAIDSFFQERLEQQLTPMDKEMLQKLYGCLNQMKEIREGDRDDA